MKSLQELMAEDRGLTWLFYGDSITHGACHTHGARDYTEHFSERIRFELGRARDVVIKTAVSGNTTRHLLTDFGCRAERFRPDVCFVMIGMNDCAPARNVSLDEFHRNLRELCGRFETLGTLVILQTTCLVLPGGDPGREGCLDAYMARVRDVASELDLPLIDHAAHWQEHGRGGRFHEWMNNAFHPNAYGHVVFAKTLLRSLGLFDESSRVGRLFHP